MIINARKMISNEHLLVLSFSPNPKLLQKSSHILTYFIKRVELLLILLKHVRVDFVDEDFKTDIWVNGVGDLYYFEKFVAGHILILLMSIYHINQRSA